LYQLSSVCLFDPAKVVFIPKQRHTIFTFLKLASGLFVFLPKEKSDRLAPAADV
jgi:hypothetical protein